MGDCSHKNERHALPGRKVMTSLWLCCVRLCATPWPAARQAPLSVRFSRQACCSGLPFPALRDPPDPGIELRSAALQADSLPFKLILSERQFGEDWRIKNNLKAAILQRSTLFMTQLSHPYTTTGKTITWLYGPVLAKWCLCFLICYLGWS